MKATDGLTIAGSYAASGLKSRPAPAEFDAGVVSGEDCPEAWWNYLWNLLTVNSDVAKADLANVLAELTTVLASSGMTPDNLTTVQVDAALKLKYLSRQGIVVTDFNTIVTATLPLGSVTAFNTGSTPSNGPAGGSFFTGLVIRSKSAGDNAMVIAIADAGIISVNSFPIAFRWRVAGTWQAWTYFKGTHNQELPVGTILMFDANRPAGGSGGASGAWVDNSTMLGWYACIAANSAWGCPDLTDKFICGKAIAGVGVAAGSNSYQITSANLPTHTHTIDHGHSAPSTGGRSAYHQHSDSGHTHTRASTSDGQAGGGEYASCGQGNWQQARSTGTGYAALGNDNADHSHTVTVTSMTGSSGNGGFANTAIDRRPSYYSVVIIRRCA